MSLKENLGALPKPNENVVCHHFINGRIQPGF
jgi:hypothetical protein